LVTTTAMTATLFCAACKDKIGFAHNAKLLCDENGFSANGDNDNLTNRSDCLGRILEALRPGFDAGLYQPPVISKSIPLSGAEQAYELVANGAPGRVVLRPDWISQDVGRGLS
jgi:hypothetical protein